MLKNGRSLPSRAVIIDVVKELRAVIFPGYFWSDSAAGMFPEYYTGYRLNDLYDRLKEQIGIALLYANEEIEQQEASEQADRICGGFFEKLPEVQERLLKMCRLVLMETRQQRARRDYFFLSGRVCNLCIPSGTYSLCGECSAYS